MASEKNGQLVTFTCDHCGEELEIAGDFQDAWQSAKDDGWRCFKNRDDEWEHRCPDCRGQ
jgi:predicted RNA-binding Zn-ribbon protein involved in translation (DUF1610 family)